MSTPKLFGKDILITSTTEATSNTIGTLATLGGINVSKTIMTAGGINSVSNTNTLGNLFTTGGNIGINTTAPTQALSVNGNFNFTGSLFQNGSVYNGSTQWGSTGANIYFNTGNVGIGMTGASSVLSISGSSSSGMLRLYPNVNRGEASIGFYENTTSGNSWVMGPNGWNVGTAFQIGYSGAPVSGPVMTLTTSGNVGIGTTTPSSRLQINSDNIGLILRTTSVGYNSTYPQVGLSFKTNVSGDNYVISEIIGKDQSTGGIYMGDLIFNVVGQSGSASLTECIRIKGQTGNVGIGTNNPSTTLDVNGSFEAIGTLHTLGSIIVSGGNVGIGTTSPGEAMDIRGNLRIGNSNTSNYITFRGTTGDNPGGYNHTYIGERIWGGTEQSELLLFKGNDISGVSGPDRIRLLASEHKFDVYTSNLSGTFDGVGSSGTNVMTINSSGAQVTGSITKTSYNSGEVIQSKCYSSAIGTSFTTSISGAYPSTVFSVSFTPLSSSSFIMVSVDCTYSVPGSGPDTLQSGITIAGTTVITKTQTWYNSGTDVSITMRGNNNSLFPLMGIAPNSNTTAKTIQVLAGRVSSDDTITLSNINIEIREIQQ